MQIQILVFWFKIFLLEKVHLFKNNTPCFKKAWIMFQFSEYRQKSCQTMWSFQYLHSLNFIRILCFFVNYLLLIQLFVVWSISPGQIVLCKPINTFMNVINFFFCQWDLISIVCQDIILLNCWSKFTLKFLLDIIIFH